MNLERNHISNFSPADIGAVLTTPLDCRVGRGGTGVAVTALIDSTSWPTLRGRAAGSGIGSAGADIASSNAAYNTRGAFASVATVAVSPETDLSLTVALSEFCGLSATAAGGADKKRHEIKRAATTDRAIQRQFRVNIVHLCKLVSRILAGILAQSPLGNRGKTDAINPLHCGRPGDRFNETSKRTIQRAIIRGRSTRTLVRVWGRG